MEKDIGRRVVAARDDSRAQERIIGEYLPFIKKQVSKMRHRDVEYDDLLSIGMLAFTQALRQYDGERGAFLPFAAQCIRARGIDEIRKSHPADIRLVEEDGVSPVDNASLARYQIEEEQRDLALEIHALDAELSRFGTSFSELARQGPKQKRSRENCRRLAAHVAGDEKLLRDFRKSGRLPQSELARIYRVPIKFLDKFRKFIIAQILILSGEYLHIAAFIRKEGKA